MEVLNGKYALERPLGVGGMAEVSLGQTLGVAGFSRQIAIKRILPSYCQDPRFYEMFIAEARLSARMVHGNVVAVTDFDQDQTGRLYLVMEFVDGADLARLAETGFLPIPVVLFVIREILCGLGYAHNLPISQDGMLGMVHRDVSPQNTLLSWDGSVKVSDFGLAKPRAATAASASAIVKGKPAYMSPEQANGEQLDGRSDLFAVGVMLWELLCGGTLFGRETLNGTIAAVMFAPVPPPRTVRPDVPPDVEAITMRLLEKRREHRFGTAEEVAALLAACDAFPKNGREFLAAVLAERLPDRVPQRRVAATPVPVTLPPSTLPTAADRARARLPPVNPYEAAAGGLAQARRARRMLWLSIAAIGIVAAAVGVTILATAGEPAPIDSRVSPAPPAPIEQSVSAPAHPPRPSPPSPATLSTERPDSSSSQIPDPAPRPPRRDLKPAPAIVPAPRERKRVAPPPHTQDQKAIREVDLGSAQSR